MKEPVRKQYSKGLQTNLTHLLPTGTFQTWNLSIRLGNLSLSSGKKEVHGKLPLVYPSLAREFKAPLNYPLQTWAQKDQNS